MIAKKIYACIILGMTFGLVIGNIVSRNCCMDKGGNEALGILIGCLSGVSFCSLFYIVSTESQRNCCSGCSNLVRRAAADDAA
mmetsp:Transcript_24923/g.39144  ORF Transcript_24923/g.39144 Transcript_24923/m.39144 type:complete len:83 (+) Transcript_24923:709-957(+)